MPHNPVSVAIATQAQLQAAQDMSSQVRVVAGPGTGKSRSICHRLQHLVASGVSPASIAVVSFTRASAEDLQRRVDQEFAGAGQPAIAAAIHVSTMHSLALTALRKANLLQVFASGPRVLDEWEQREVFDAEFAASQQITPTRAKEIRLAFDAYWQTLSNVPLVPITTSERSAFQAFHAERATLYSSILPGEIVRRLVDATRVGAVVPRAVLGVDHLIVDEFQDLNFCDQSFIASLAGAGAVLWVAGDDDQSVYSFRHSAPSGLQQFPSNFPGASTHLLAGCFRCAPIVVSRANSLITRNPSPPRIAKSAVSLYTGGSPAPVGMVDVWELSDGAAEADAVADSCRELISAGISPDDLLILIANKRAQLSLISDALDARGLPFSVPRGPSLRDTPMGRVLYCALRIMANSNDYIAHRDLLGLLDQVGLKTCLAIADFTVQSGIGFLDLFQQPPVGLRAAAAAAVQRVSSVRSVASSWAPTDDLASRDASVAALLAAVLNTNTSAFSKAIADWQALRAQLPDAMSVEELMSYGVDPI